MSWMSWRDSSVLAGHEQHLAGVSGEEVDRFVDLAERHAVGDQPVEVEAAGVEQKHGLLPGVPEPPAEDAAQGDALLVDVGGDVDLSRSARVSDGHEGRLAAQGLE